MFCGRSAVLSLIISQPRSTSAVGCCQLACLLYRARSVLTFLSCAAAAAAALHNSAALGVWNHQGILTHHKVLTGYTIRQKQVRHAI